MNQIWLLLLIFITCAAISFLLCNIAKLLFPKFRSGEHKPGIHRPDLPAGGREIKTIELPLVGGPAFILAIVSTALGAGYFLKFSPEQWTLLLIGLGATVCYATVGFIDDWRKVYGNEGLSEHAKFLGVFAVGAVAAILFFFLLPSVGQEAYGVWKDLPLLSDIWCAKLTVLPDQPCPVTFPHVSYFAWLIFLVLMIGLIGSFTSLSVDFSDGLDGLAGGLVFSAALALGIVIASVVNKQFDGVVLEMLALVCAGGVLGYLPWNWPSSWAARKGKAPRRAKIIMGDSGSLGMGGMLAMIALFSRNELLLLMIGGAFVLEGLSALIQSRVMTPLFRHRLKLLRYASSKEWVQHTEFPLPFLATPMHCHFDLLGWDRRRLVYGAWALGACFAALGVMSSTVGFTWQRYVARILVLILMGVVWSSGSWSKCYFVGKHPAERTRRRRLALYYGYPYQIMGIKLYHLVEIIEASEDVIETPAEEVSLWQRMTIFDARAMLGLYCYRAGYYPAALAQWTRIPERNRVLRPVIANLLDEVDNRLALEKQETQPMRRDQIMQQQPIFSGNLSPADLPNPHEPVSHEETEDGHREAWDGRQSSSYALDSDDEEERQITVSLSGERGDTAPVGSSNGHSVSSSLGNGRSQSSIMLGSLQRPAPPSRTRPNWLMRLLRPSSNK